MRTRWRDLVNGFWFVPGAVASGLAVLALLLIQIDRSFGIRGVPLVFGGDASAARDLLSTISGSLITVAGVAFSLTIVVLSLVSSQFTPRALPSFLSDRINQIVVGSFLGIFAYCLLVLRTIRDAQGRNVPFVPSLSVTVAIALALVALGLLILFIHHMGQSIQVGNIAARIGVGALSTVDALHPDRFGERSGPERDARVEDDSAQVFAQAAGFVRAIEADDLVEQLSESGLRVLLTVAPGDFVTPATVVAEVAPASGVDDQVKRCIVSKVLVEAERDTEQNVGFAVRQLADIALRGLSPGINDPTTAVNCIGYLRAILERLAQRDIPAQVVHGTEGGTRIVARQHTFDVLVHEAFDEIGRYASPNARVAVAVVDALLGIARAASDAGARSRHRVLNDVGHAVLAQAIDDARTEQDRSLLQQRRVLLDVTTG